MKILFWAGVVVLALGIASLFVAIPRRESHGVRAGNISLGVQVTSHEKVPPVISAVLIVGGVSMMIGGRARK